MIRFEKLKQTVKVRNIKTNEVRDAELTKIYTITENGEKFYQQYCNGVVAILGIKPDICGNVYMYLCMNQNKNQIYIDSHIRKDIAKKCKISEPTVFRAIKALLDNGIISKQSRGFYNINPWYSWDGSQEERMKLLDNATVTVRIDIHPNEEIYQIESEVEKVINNFENART